MVATSTGRRASSRAWSRAWPRWVRQLLYGAAVLLALATAVQVYSVLPARFPVRPLSLPPDTRELVLLFHGSGGQDEPGLAALEERLRRLAPTRSRSVIRRYIWAPYSDDKLRAFPNGDRVGSALGEELAGLSGLETIHLIAHSAGAYVLEPGCEAYRARTASRPPAAGVARITMTYLDPIGFRGPLDPGWGSRTYGRCADEAEAFINTDDPVPATAAVLQHARTTDVTADPGRAKFDGGGHRWPVQYYADHLTPTGGRD
ncbi:MAG: hypothetical protein ABI661_04150 [Gammaproteobacteria bacterium]